MEVKWYLPITINSNLKLFNSMQTHLRSSEHKRVGDLIRNTKGVKFQCCNGF